MSAKTTAMNEGQAGTVRSTILLVDDHPIVCEGLSALINQQADLVVCGQAADAVAALQAVEKLHPDLAIVDISLNGGSGLELIKNLRVLHPTLPILALSMHDETIYAERALRAGARGYVMKREATEKLLTAVRRILEGGLCISEYVSRTLVQRAIDGTLGSREKSPVDQLSDRELEVFQMIGRGVGTREIAREMNLSIKTVETHCTHIKQKLDLKSSTLLIRAAVEWVQETSK